MKKAGSVKLWPCSEEYEMGCSIEWDNGIDDQNGSMTMMETN
jgi:hypothetical protein